MKQDLKGLACSKSFCKFGFAFLLLLVVHGFGTRPFERHSFAGEFNTARDIGDQVSGWAKLPAADGKKYAFQDFDDYDILVVAFTSNSCPYAVDYEDRMNELAKGFADRKLSAALVAINCNNIDADRLPAMKERAKEKGFAFTYLHDQSQQVAKDFGAKRTPEFFVLGKDRRIAYMGAMDDNTKSDQVKVRYVQSAVESLLAGTTIGTAETAPVGCLIRFDRKRGGRPD